MKRSSTNSCGNQGRGGAFHGPCLGAAASAKVMRLTFLSDMSTENAGGKWRLRNESGNNSGGNLEVGVRMALFNH